MNCLIFIFKNNLKNLFLNYTKQNRIKSVIYYMHLKKSLNMIIISYIEFQSILDIFENLKKKYFKNDF